MFVIADKDKKINQNKKLAAYQMSAAGFNLLPLKEADKVPEFDLLLGNSTKPYLENKASANIVKSWFDNMPKINFGVFAGTKINDQYVLIIIDLDKKPDFGLPITPIAKTSRGYHLYFKCRADKLPEPHKTARGEIKTAGYVVAPPSRHPSGINYQWAEYLSFKDVPLADFSDRREQITNFLDPNFTPSESTNKTANKKDYTRININTSVVPSELRKEDLEIKIKKGSNKELLIRLSKDEKVCLEVMRSLFNVKVNRIGQAFKCPLHSEKKPSAALYKTDNGVIGFKDFHRAGSFYTLPEVYYQARTGKQQNIKGATSLIWWIRMLKDSGIIELPKIIPPKEINQLPDKQKELLSSFIELLEIRQAYNTEQDSTPFSHRFAADWSGLKYDTVRYSKTALIKKGIIKKVEAGDKAKRRAGKFALKGAAANVSH